MSIVEIAKKVIINQQFPLGKAVRSMWSGIQEDQKNKKNAPVSSPSRLGTKEKHR